MKKLFLVSFSILLLSIFTLNLSAQSKDSGKTIQNAQVRIEQIGSFVSSMGIDGGVKKKYFLKSTSPKHRWKRLLRRSQTTKP